MAPAPVLAGGSILDAPLAPCARRRVLLVEDNDTNRKLAQAILERRGHQVLVASNGREALRLTDLHSVNVILMDLQMPELGGEDATKLIRLRERGTGRRVRIVAVTGMPCRARARDAWRPGWTTTCRSRFVGPTCWQPWNGRWRRTHRSRPRRSGAKAHSSTRRRHSTATPLSSVSAGTRCLRARWRRRSPMRSRGSSPRLPRPWRPLIRTPCGGPRML
ncbi:MAG: response regulator [Acidobacteria bacterium]|nr:response regulator [Acidobacteriota bacterium]